MSLRVQFWSPNRPEKVHTAVEAILAQALRQRGADVRFLAGPMLEDSPPDIVISWSGAYGQLQEAAAVVEKHGGRFITWDLGPSNSHIRLVESGPVGSIAPNAKQFDNWRDIPLDSNEIVWAHNLVWRNTNGHGTPLGGIRYALDIGERPIVALFVAKEDAGVGRAGSEEAFSTYKEWIDTVINGNCVPEEAVVVIHIDSNDEDLSIVEQMVAKAQHTNIRVVNPSSNISARQICQEANVGLVWCNTNALSMATRGIPVISAVRGWLGNSGCVESYGNIEEWKQALMVAVTREASGEIARRAYRFVCRRYGFGQIPLPIVRWDEQGSVKVTCRSAKDLAPGKHPSLDRIIATILTGEERSNGPTAEDRGRSTSDEDRMIPRLQPHIRTMSAADQLVHDGERVFGTGDTMLAIRLFMQALEAEPNHVQAWNDLGVSLFCIGEIEAAEEALSTAIKNGPDEINARINLADMLWRTSRVSEAQTQARQILAIVPGQPDAQRLLVRMAG